MKVILERKDNAYHFEGKGQSDVPVSIDSSAEGNPKGASPMELLLMGVGGCSAIDVVSILKKQRQEISSYRMEVEGERIQVREANPFKEIHVKIFLEGNIDPAKAIRAAELSFEKYCSVSITMEASVKVSFSMEVNGTKVFPKP